MRFKVGDKVKLRDFTKKEIFDEIEEYSGCGMDVDYFDELEESYMRCYIGVEMTIIKVDMVKKCYETDLDCYFNWLFDDIMLKGCKMNKEEKENDKMKIKIKYFDGAKKLEKISKGDWIDLYANEDVFVPQGKRAMIPLGIAMELPEGYEAHVVPRSSTFKTWGIIQTNHMGVIDNSFCGDNDEWCMPVYCLESKHFVDTSDNDKIKSIKDVENGIIIDVTKNTFGTLIRKGDKISQFRVMEVQPSIEFEEVEVLDNKDRGMCGTTGAR